MKSFFRKHIFVLEREGNKERRAKLSREEEENERKLCFQFEFVCEKQFYSSSASSPVFPSICVRLPLLSICAPFLISPWPTCLCFQVSQDGKALLDVLQRPLSPGNSESLTATANYSKAVSTIMFLYWIWNLLLASH